MTSRFMSLGTALLVLASLAPAQIEGGPVCNAPGTENFDSATVGNPGTYPTGWVDGGGTWPWRVHTGGTTSGNTGPSGDHTGSGNYIYTETSSPTALGDTFIIDTPCYDISTLGSPTVFFWVHMYGATVGSLDVEVDADGTGFVNAFNLTGGQGNQWSPVQIPLTGSQVIIRIIGTRGSSFTGDIGIDDVTVGEEILAPYETNSVNASLDLDGVQGTQFASPVVNVATGITTTLNIGGAGYYPYDIYIGVGAAVPGYLRTAGGQVVNVAIFSPGFFGLWGGPGNVSGLVPFTGNFSISFSETTALDAVGQMLKLSPANPDGFDLSQPANVSFRHEGANGPSNISGLGTGTNLGLSDDDFSQQALGFTFNFFGTGYTDVFVGSNGHMTFGTGNNGWSSAPAAMNSATWATIAPCSEDFNPSAGGAVEFTTEPGTQTFGVWWNNVPSYGSSNSNTFQVTAANGGLILFDYDSVFDETEGTVGLSPGNSINAVQPVNISQAGGFNPAVVVLPGNSPIEDFTSTSPNDLAGLQVQWTLDATGTPILVN